MGMSSGVQVHRLGNRIEGDDMLHYAVIFFVIGLIALALGAGGVAGLSIQLGIILFVVFLIMAVLSFFFKGARRI